MARKTMVEAIRDAMDVSMARDEGVVVFGEDVGFFGGVFRCTQGLQAKYGKSRCFDAPINESGIVGAAIAKAGSADSLLSAGISKTVAFIVISPLFGYILGSLILVVVAWVCRNKTQRRVDKWFRRLQLVSAALYSLGHGGNDAQKTVGIIWMLLIAAGVTAQGDPVPMWVVVLCYMAIGLGTLFGGWRIVKTMGQRITKLKPVGGFCAETGGAITLFLATSLGIPVSTTHTITGAIVGVGSVRRTAAVRWGVAGSIVWAWVLTIPCSALIAAGGYWLGRGLF